MAKSQCTTPNDELKRLVTSGSVEYIFEVDQSVFLIEACGQTVEFANEHRFGELFGTIQAFAVAQCVFCMTKLYESPNGRYPNVSLPSVLQFISDHTGDIQIAQQAIVSPRLKSAGINIDGFCQLDRAEANTRLAQGLLNSLATVDGDEALAALKTLRDKKLAHPEDIPLEDLAKTTWAELDRLLTHAKLVVGILGDAYLGTAYADNDGNYLPTQDGARVGQAFRQLVRLASA